MRTDRPKPDKRGASAPNVGVPMARPAGDAGADASSLPWPYPLSRDALLAKVMAYSAVDERTKVINGARCRTWRRGKNGKGYGIVCIGDGRNTSAHRVAWMAITGQVLPQGIVPDHSTACLNHACIEPRHLDIVTDGENTRRGRSPWAENANRTECVKGHPFDSANTILRQRPWGVQRQCRACQNAASREWWRERYRDPAFRARHRKRLTAYNAAHREEQRKAAADRYAAKKAARASRRSA